MIHNIPLGIKGPVFSLRTSHSFARFSSIFFNQDWKDAICESRSVAPRGAAAALGVLSKKKCRQLKDPSLEIGERKSKSRNWGCMSDSSPSNYGFFPPFFNMPQWWASSLEFSELKATFHSNGFIISASTTHRNPSHTSFATVFLLT